MLWLPVFFLLYWFAGGQIYTNIPKYTSPVFAWLLSCAKVWWLVGGSFEQIFRINNFIPTTLTPSHLHQHHNHPIYHLMLINMTLRMMALTILWMVMMMIELWEWKWSRRSTHTGRLLGRSPRRPLRPLINSPHLGHSLIYLI